MELAIDMKIAKNMSNRFPEEFFVNVGHLNDNVWFPVFSKKNYGYENCISYSLSLN